jgi:maleate isomerase
VDYDRIMEDLLEATAASRTTLRLDHPTLNYPVAGEACAPGVPSIRHDNSIDQRGGATAQWILRTGRILVAEDARNSDPAPPQAIVDVYGLRAFLLVPLRRKAPDALLGWISVHENRDTRHWAADDLTAAEIAVERVHEEFDASGDPFAAGS